MRKFTIASSVFWMLLMGVTINAQNLSNNLTKAQIEVFETVIKEQKPNLYNRVFHSDQPEENSNIRVTKIANTEGEGLSQRLIEEWKNNEWENKILWTFTFSEGSSTSTTLQQGWVNNGWVNQYFDTTTMDNQQNPIEDITQKWENNDWVNDYKTTMNYNNNNDMTELTFFEWNDSTKTWINEMRITYTHDNNNNVIEDLMEFWEADSWVGFQKGIHTYNAKNLVITSLTQMWFGTEWSDWAKITYTYNAKDLCIDELHESLSFITSTWVTSSHWIYEYNNEDQAIVTLIEEYDPFTSARIGYTKVLSTYNGDYLIEEVTQEWGASDWENEEKETYTYEDGRLTVVLYQVWENNNWVNRERWTDTYDGAVDVANESDIPSEFELMQNYPNPFNPVTTIAYTLNIKENVELIVYDILGNYLSTLVNETQNPGNYYVKFDAENYATGTYIYKLKSGNNVMIKKCLLIK